MALTDEVSEIATAAGRYADADEVVAAVLVAEPSPGERTYLCAFDGPSGRSWLALDEAARPVTARKRLREAISIAAMCEVAEESAGGGDLEELRAQLLTLRLTEHPAGIEEAETAALELEAVIGAPPRVASPAYLESLGEATRRLEHALGENAGSSFAAAMRGALGAVEELTKVVEGDYRLPLDGSS